MCDPFPPQVEVKGGSVPNTSEHFIICSNAAPWEQYPSVAESKPATFRAYLRRINNEHDCSLLSYSAIEAIIREFLSDVVLDTQLIEDHEYADYAHERDCQL